MRALTRSGRPPRGEGKEIRSASSTSRSRSVFHVETEDVCEAVSSSSSVAAWVAVMSKRTVEDVGPTDETEGEGEEEGEEEGEGGVTGLEWGAV